MESTENIIACDLKSVKIIRKSAILRSKDVTAYCKYIFDQCDTNKDGQICVKELMEFLANNEGDVPVQLVCFIHNTFDKDHNKTLDFDEFLDLICHPRIKETFKRIGSKYLEYVAESSVRRKDLTVRRTTTNTGLYDDEATFNQYTLGLITISIVQIICFYVNKSYDDVVGKYTKFTPSKRYEVWRYFTFVFAHRDCAHLYGNVVLQLLIGLPLEMVHRWRVPVIYFVGSLGGCLTDYLWNSNGLIGGSAGAYAFYSAHCAAVIMNWREMNHPIISIIIFVLLIAFDAVRNFFVDDRMITMTSHLSHVGGVIVGLPLGIIILRNLKVTRAEKIVWYLSATVLGLLLCILITLNAVIDH